LNVLVQALCRPAVKARGNLRLHAVAEPMAIIISRL
jgi:hypothetical protein